MYEVTYRTGVRIGLWMRCRNIQQRHLHLHYQLQFFDVLIRFCTKPKKAPISLTYTPRLRPIQQLAQSIPWTVPDYYERKDFNRSSFSSQDTYHAPISGSTNRGHKGYLKTIIKQLYRNF
eukprot:TRINITY_DN29308_c1_g1_i1.p1 TRINITY_DN29308_c1_g1~~TRINITY_DN29308_c1_g1_i1.p1  ORF type:complete len:120 (+),score=0.43 TRINITY_DN29308_c1_g1_i1:896-1255(+)